MPRQAFERIVLAVARGTWIASGAAVLAAILACASPSGAQTAYPERAVTIIVPFAAGGPNDIVARILAQALTESLGQSVIVENRPGAAGNTGTAAAARAAPDGYTLLVTSTSIAVNRALFKNLPYDVFKDFAPVSELVNATNLLVTGTGSGITGVADLVARAKAAPGTFNYSSPGMGTKAHLATELLKLRAGIEITHVPYRGAEPAALAAMAGTVQLAAVAPPQAEQLIKAGQLRGIAVTSAKRWFSLPEVPTMIESGYPNFVSDTFNAVFAPAGTSPEIIALLARESRKAFERPDVRERARLAGFEVTAGTPEQLAARVAAEVEAVREVVVRAGIQTQ